MPWLISASEYAAVCKKTQTIKPTQRAKSLYAALRTQITKNPEALVICHCQYIDAVDTMPTVTTVYTREELSNLLVEQAEAV